MTILMLQNKFQILAQPFFFSPPFLIFNVSALVEPLIQFQRESQQPKENKFFGAAMQSKRRSFTAKNQLQFVIWIVLFPIRKAHNK